MPNIIIKDKDYYRKENGAYAAHLSQKGRGVRKERVAEIERQEEKMLSEGLKYFRNKTPRNQREADYIMNKIFKAHFKPLK